MHTELIVPGLFARPPGARLPGLELLLARSRSTAHEARSTEAALYELFDLEDEPVAAGALTYIAAERAAGDASWLRADPVHLRLMRDRLIVMPAEAIGVSASEARTLCDALNTHFAGKLVLDPVYPTRWCARTASEAVLNMNSALDVAGREVNLSQSADKRVHALVNEAQMLLYAHPVNEAREARGEPAINSLWLWGAGRAPKLERAPWRSVAADDPVALGLARLGGSQPRTLPESADIWMAALPENGRHLALLDALRAPHALGQEAEYREALERLERQWFAPLLAALREGRIGMVTLHVPDSPDGASFETIRADLRRFWRRSRSLEHYA
ncbi:MAG TPA: hypothetical protein VD965_08875 [Burkholderiales bacterium]|nr:hypothetical protein [Burkholderiales bacterium]